MAQALTLVIEIGHAFGSRPEAVQGVAQIPALALALFSGGLIVSAIARGALRWAGVGFIGAAVLVGVLAPRPVLIATADLSTVLYRDDGGAWHAVQEREKAVPLVRTAAVVGLPPAVVERLPVEGACASAACIWSVSGGLTVTWVTAEEGFAAACAAPGLLLSAHPVPPALRTGTCRATLVVDGPMLAERGGMRLKKTWIPWPRARRLTVDWVRPYGPQRPWQSSPITADPQL
jgi:hypothetical protein